MGNLGKTRGLPQALGFLCRVLQALLDFDPLMGANEVSQDDGVLARRVKGLVAPTALVIDVLAGDVPLLLIEYFASEDLVGVR